MHGKSKGKLYKICVFLTNKVLRGVVNMVADNIAKKVAECDGEHREYWCYNWSRCTIIPFGSEEVDCKYCMPEEVETHIVNEVKFHGCGRYRTDYCD